MAFDHSYRKGHDWTQAIGRLDPGKDKIALILSGEVVSSLENNQTAEVDLTSGESGPFHLQGAGFRKGAYTDTLLSCREVWFPFYTSDGVFRWVILPVNTRTSFKNWIYLWTTESSDRNLITQDMVTCDSSSFDIPDPEEAYWCYRESSSYQELDYECIVRGPGNVLFIDYQHPNYLTTDDYNGLLGNVSEKSEPDTLRRVERIETKPGRYIFENIKNYVYDDHKPNAVGGTHAGEFTIDNGLISKYQKYCSYTHSFETTCRNNEDAAAQGGDNAPTVQTLDFPFLSYRAISASVYVDRYQYNETASGGRNILPDSIEKVWEDLQGGNVDDPETIYFTGTATLLPDPSGSGKSVVFDQRTSIPVTGSILFTIKNNLAVRYVEATIYAPFLNTVYRTNKFGAVTELFTSGSDAEE